MVRPVGIIPADITNDTPAAYKIVILGLVPSIRAGDGIECLSRIAETCAAWDPRVTDEDDDGGAFRPRISSHGRWYYIAQPFCNGYDRRRDAKLDAKPRSRPDSLMGKIMPRFSRLVPRISLPGRHGARRTGTVQTQTGKAGLNLSVLLAFLAICSSACAAGQRVALVVGNSAYVHQPVLPNPGADARGIAAVLSSLGFEHGQVEPLLDLNLRQLLLAVRAFGERARDAEVAVVYFSGHGLQLSQSDGTESYLLPVDAELLDARDVPHQALSVRELLFEAGHTQGGVVVLLDACRNNPAVARMAGMGTRGATRSGLVPMAQNSLPLGVLVSYATSGGEVSYDGSGRNSPYATALMKHLPTPERDVAQVLRRVRVDVLQSTGGKQKPEIVDNLNGDVFMTPTQVAARPPTQPSPLPGDGSNREMLFWQSIMNSTNRADFEAYLETYPGGSFAPIARNRIAGQPRPVEAATSAPGNAPLVQQTPPPDEWTAAERRVVRWMLRIMILYKGAADEAPVEAALHASYQRYIAIAGKDELGTASGQSRGNLPKTAAQLDQLLKRPSYSPRGVAAASVSDTKARYDRGLAADNPPAGKGRDPDEAIFWYGMAAQAMDPRGLTQLGVLHARGQEKVSIAMDNASLLWWIASTRGEATAMFNLGAMHEHGVGIPANKKVARAWYEAAARHGNPAAPAALERTAVRE